MDTNGQNKRLNMLVWPCAILKRRLVECETSPILRYTLPVAYFLLQKTLIEIDRRIFGATGNYSAASSDEHVAKFPIELSE